MKYNDNPIIAKIWWSYTVCIWLTVKIFITFSDVNTVLTNNRVHIFHQYVLHFANNKRSVWKPFVHPTLVISDVLLLYIYLASFLPFLLPQSYLIRYISGCGALFEAWSTTRSSLHIWHAELGRQFVPQTHPLPPRAHSGNSRHLITEAERGSYSVHSWSTSDCQTSALKRSASHERSGFLNPFKGYSARNRVWVDHQGVIWYVQSHTRISPLKTVQWVK